MKAGYTWVLLLKISECFLKVFIELLLILLSSQIIKVCIDKLERVCFLCCYIDLLISSVRLSKKDISLDVCIEKNRLLHDIAALLSELKNIISFQMLTIYQNIA